MSALGWRCGRSEWRKARQGAKGQGGKCRRGRRGCGCGCGVCVWRVVGRGRGTQAPSTQLPAGLRLMAYGIWALYEHDLRTACEYSCGLDSGRSRRRMAYVTRRLLLAATAFASSRPQGCASILLPRLLRTCEQSAHENFAKLSAIDGVGCRSAQKPPGGGCVQRPAPVTCSGGVA
jgi:hypothetical protein